MFAILFAIFIIICIVIVACKCSSSPSTNLSTLDAVVRPKGCKSCQPEKKSCATGLCSKKFGCGN